MTPRSGTGTTQPGGVDPVRSERWNWWVNRRNRFKAGSWANRTIYRIGDYWWFWLCFKPARRAARRG